MSDELNSQLSAFVDNELSPEESELLVRRLCRNESMRTTAATYTFIGSVMRGEMSVTAPADFAGRVQLALAGQQVPEARTPAVAGSNARTWGMAVAASAVLAAVALLTLPDRSADEPPAIAATAGPAANLPEFPVAGGSGIMTLMPETGGVTPDSFNVPMVVPANRHSAENRARLNKYLLRHVSTTGASRQGMATFRNVGFVTQAEADQ